MEIRYLGEFDADEASMRRVVKRLADKHERIMFCYEAGPTGYGLYRLIRSMGHECVVVAPSLIPRRPGDQVKTNRRDALGLARLLRAGELTSVWVSMTSIRRLGLPMFSLGSRNARSAASETCFLGNGNRARPDAPKAREYLMALFQLSGRSSAKLGISHTRPRALP
jgi:hypothetical protein